MKTGIFFIEVIDQYEIKCFYSRKTFKSSTIKLLNSPIKNAKT